MKFVWILFGVVMALILTYGIWQNDRIQHETLASDGPRQYTGESTNGGQVAKPEPGFLFGNPKKSVKLSYRGKVPRQLLPDSIVAFGLKQIGVPYLPAGITCEGFDCSGFVYFIFKRYGVDLPHSSAMLAKEGDPVPLEEARKGDLIIFTGTNAADRTPGHVGVVITNPGEPVKFVHASSSTREGGVKISPVEPKGYGKRFLEVRRVL